MVSASDNLKKTQPDRRPGLIQSTAAITARPVMALHVDGHLVTKKEKDTSGTPDCGCSPGDLSNYAPAAPRKNIKVKQEDPESGKKQPKANH